MNAPGSLVTNVFELLPSLLGLMDVFAAMVAVVLVIMGLSKFAELARSGSNGSVRAATPWMYLIAAAMLFNLGTSVSGFLETIYGNGSTTENLLSYTASPAMPEQTQQWLGMVIALIRAYGYYAMIRGFIRLKDIGSGVHSQDGSPVGSAFWHIFGGAAAVNLVATVNLVSSFIGFGDVL